MTKETSKIFKFIVSNPAPVVSVILLINFIVRLIIYHRTRLFDFSDYSVYLNGIENIAKGETQYLLIGNSLFSISYIGYFAKYILGSINYFFVFNCFLGTLSSLIVYFLIIKVTGSLFAGILTVIIHTFYTEFMVFSSVFYTPVIMIFLLTLFTLLIFFYLNSKNTTTFIISLFLTILVFILTFFFKPELKYLPWFLLLAGIILIKRHWFYSKKILILAFLLLTSYFLLQYSGIISHPPSNIISNSFIMFGHTDYGGDGGEGSFIYPENKARYDAALKEFLEANKIINPGIEDYNAFQKLEIKKYIIHHPIKWICLQGTKFFRTFGVVPESTSFKILYSGLFKRNLWLTSLVVVAPVAIIVLLLIAFFNFSSIRKLLDFSLHPAPSTQHQVLGTLRTHNNNHFLCIYCLLFFYYLIATIFFGQYQERYRLPVFVVFIIPLAGYFLTTFTRKNLLNKTSLTIKSIVIMVFLVIWIFQARNAINNKERLNHAFEKIDNQSNNL